jgi:Domain of unknown function (DUF1963)
MEASDRRGFLRSILREAAKGAQEAAQVIGPPGLGSLLSDRDEDVLAESAPVPVASLPLQPARTPTATLTRDDTLRALAATGLRLTPADDGPSARAWLGGAPELPDEVEWPHWGGALLTLVAQIDLAATPLGLDGQLLLFFDTVRAPSGMQAGAAGSSRALRVAAAPPPPGGQPMRLDGELMLPSVWAPAVQGLGLGVVQQGAYQEVRRLLAQRQGVELEEGTGASTAYHRVLGLPDDVLGAMALTCELTSRGLDGDEWQAAPDAQAAAGRWRLLAQVTRPEQRVFFWIASDDLDAGDFSRVWAIPQG